MAWRNPRLGLKTLCGSVLAGLVSACMAAEPVPVDLVELGWIAPEGDPVLVLTTKPATCLTETSDTAQAGELLFNSPLLLGGQAAKAELHCASCHVNGRGNDVFAFQGVSGDAGTADVTHGLFGPERADDTFNPVLIPDLATADGQSRVDRDTPGILEAFLSAQIIEEFSGSAPAEPTIDALAAYIRAIDGEACDLDAVEPLSWRDDVRRVDLGLRLLSEDGALDRNALVNAVRSALGRLHARYSMEGHAELRGRLLDLSRALGAGGFDNDLDADLAAIEILLERHEGESLFDLQTLRIALDAKADGN